jgi:hypothetical protein
MDGEYVLALLKWLGVDEFDQPPDTEAIIEAQNALEFIIHEAPETTKVYPGGIEEPELAAEQAEVLAEQDAKKAEAEAERAVDERAIRGDIQERFQ